MRQPAPGGRSGLKLTLLIGFCLLAPAVIPGPLQAQGAGGQTSLGRPGYLVLEAARDTAANFRWDNRGGDPERVLAWPEGRLSLPDSALVEEFSRTDLGVAVGPGFAGRGGRGQLRWQDGIYPVTEEVTLSDGTVTCVLWGGELEISGPMIRYRTVAAEEPASWKAGLAFLAGMTLLVWTLLRRSRLGWKDKGMPS